MTNPGAATKAQRSIEKILKKHERYKKGGLQRKNRECGTMLFYPISVYRIRGARPGNEKFHKHLADDKIAAKPEGE